MWWAVKRVGVWWMEVIKDVIAEAEQCSELRRRKRRRRLKIGKRHEWVYQILIPCKLRDSLIAWWRKTWKLATVLSWCIVVGWQRSSTGYGHSTNAPRKWKFLRDGSINIKGFVIILLLLKPSYDTKRMCCMLVFSLQYKKKNARKKHYNQWSTNGKSMFFVIISFGFLFLVEWYA